MWHPIFCCPCVRRHLCQNNFSMCFITWFILNHEMQFKNLTINLLSMQSTYDSSLQCMYNASILFTCYDTLFEASCLCPDLWYVWAPCFNFDDFIIMYMFWIQSRKCIYFESVAEMWLFLLDNELLFYLLHLLLATRWKSY